jgi:hypothetical protein
MWSPGLRCVLSLLFEHWNLGLQSQSGLGYMSAFLLWLCCPVLVTTLRQTISQKSYHLSLRIHSFRLILVGVEKLNS